MKNIKRDTFILYRSFYESVQWLDKNIIADVFTAICEYSLNGKEIELEWISKNIFILIKPQLEANNRKYLNWKQGWRPEKNWENSQKPNDNQTETKNKPNWNQTESKVKANDKWKMYNDKWLMIKEKWEISKELLYNREEYQFVEDFLDRSNSIVEYCFNKYPNYLETQWEAVDKLIKQWYTLETIKTVLKFVKQDQFWNKNILSVKKLLEKNKDWVQYMIVMIERIKEFKPKAIDLDALYNNW